MHLVSLGTVGPYPKALRASLSASVEEEENLGNKAKTGKRSSQRRRVSDNGRFYNSKAVLCVAQVQVSSM